jgi:dGTPase
VLNTEAAIAAAKVKSADDVRACRRSLVRYSPERKKQNQELRKYLYQNLYYSQAVDEPNKRAIRMLAEVFKSYLENPAEMGEGARRRVKTDGLHRAVCDYVALMTDRFCMKEHRRLFGLDLGI